MRCKRKKFNGNGLGIAMTTPAMLLIFFISFVPMVLGVAYSFMDYRLNRPQLTGFNGIQNYISVLGDSEFYSMVLFTLVYAVLSVGIAYVFALFLAILMNRKMKGRGIFRSLILLPWVVSNAVLAVNWKWILNDRFGIVNNTLKNLGLIDEPIYFFSSEFMARASVIAISAWKIFPFILIVILAGFQGIPDEIYESAKIDGAGFWKTLFRITLPMIKDLTIMCTTLEFMWTFNNYEQIALLTDGGPNRLTYTLPIYIYNTSFVRMNIGEGSAAAVMVMLVMIVFVIIRSKLQNQASR